jgi:hypothetical protein
MLPKGVQLSSTNRKDCHEMTEILLKVAISTFEVIFSVRISAVDI